MKKEKRNHIGYGRGRFTLDENGCPVDRRKKDRRVHDKGRNARRDKELGRKGVEVCSI